jgi:diguanylate cyclase (GGDEF)-like protein
MQSPVALLLVILLSAAAGAALAGVWAWRRFQTQLAALVDRDRVTGLSERSTMLASLGRYRALAERVQHPLTVLFIEVDGREALSARLPLPERERLEKLLASRMAERVRAYDQLGQWDRWQFLLLMPHSDISSALVLVDDLRQVVADPVLQPPAGGQPLTISVGLHALTPDRTKEHPTSAEALVAAARRALEATAADGPNRIEVEP